MGDAVDGIRRRAAFDVAPEAGAELEELIDQGGIPTDGVDLTPARAGEKDGDIHDVDVGDVGLPLRLLEVVVGHLIGPRRAPAIARMVGDLHLHEPSPRNGPVGRRDREWMRPGAEAVVDAADLPALALAYHRAIKSSSHWPASIEALATRDGV